jgi:hypothetical protein
MTDGSAWRRLRLCMPWVPARDEREDGFKPRKPAHLSVPPLVSVPVPTPVPMHIRQAHGVPTQFLRWTLIHSHVLPA